MKGLVRVMKQLCVQLCRSKAEEMLRILEEKIASDSLPEFKKLLYTLTNLEGGDTKLLRLPNNKWLCRGKE